MTRLPRLGEFSMYRAINAVFCGDEIVAAHLISALVDIPLAYPTRSVLRVKPSTTEAHILSALPCHEAGSPAKISTFLPSEACRLNNVIDTTWTIRSSSIGSRVDFPIFLRPPAFGSLRQWSLIVEPW